MDNQHTEDLPPVKGENPAINLGHILKTGLNKMIAQLNADSACVWLYDEAFHTLIQVGVEGNPIPITGPAMTRLVEPFAEDAIFNHRILLFDDVVSRPLSNSGKAFLTKIGFKCAVITSLALGETITGVLGIFFKDDCPTENDLNFSQVLTHSTTSLALSIQSSAALADRLYIVDVRMSRAYETSILGWIQILQLRNVDLAKHSRSIAMTSAKLAQSLGLDDKSIGQIYRAAMLHDIGKIALPDEILRAKRPLSEEDEQTYRQHVLAAEEILSPVAPLKVELSILVSHHERWDGNGYPHHLAGDEIPIGGRMIAVADAWDFLRSPGQGHKPYPSSYAINRIKKESGSAFDPEIVTAFLALLPK